MALSIYFIVTPKCNLYCKPCHVSAGPKKSVPDPEMVVRIAERLPSNLFAVVLGGGEPLYDKNEVTVPFLEAIGKRREAQSISLSRIYVQTNGKIFFDDWHCLYTPKGK